MNDLEDTLKRLSQQGHQVRLSNKCAAGYWWCYIDDDIVAQGSSPKGAVDVAVAKMDNVTVHVDRDPRVEPKDGDKVEATSGVIRTVTGRLGPLVWYWRAGTLCDGQCSLDSWRRWCKTNKARVVKKGE